MDVLILLPFLALYSAPCPMDALTETGLRPHRRPGDSFGDALDYLLGRGARRLSKGLHWFLEHAPEGIAKPVPYANRQTAYRNLAMSILGWDRGPETGSRQRASGWRV